MGIVGLPNVGKSSTFNLMTKCSIPAENFPFCTIDPNNARVNVPDARFNWLVDTYKPKSQVPAFLEVRRSIPIADTRVRPSYVRQVKGVTSAWSAAFIFCVPGHAERPICDPYDDYRESLSLAVRRSPGCIPQPCESPADARSLSRGHRWWTSPGW